MVHSIFGSFFDFFLVLSLNVHMCWCCLTIVHRKKSKPYSLLTTKRNWKKKQKNLHIISCRFLFFSNFILHKVNTGTGLLNFFLFNSINVHIYKYLNTDQTEMKRSKKNFVRKWNVATVDWYYNFNFLDENLQQ